MFDDCRRSGLVHVKIAHGWSRRVNPGCFGESGNTAFTLIDLLALVAVVAAFAALALPALAQTRFRGKVAACTSTMHQWATVARMYAQDDAKSRLPAFGSNGAGNPWDASLSLLTNLAPYGFTVPMWFCPVRVLEFETVQNWARSHTPSGTTSSLGDLEAYLVATGSDTLHWNYWVVRGSSPYPNNANTIPGTAPYNPGQAGLFNGTGFWPVHTTDPKAASIPFLSDVCFSAGNNPLGSSKGSTNVATIYPGSAHFFGAQVANVNCAYGDGHVEEHPKANIGAVYTGANGSIWFY